MQRVEIWLFAFKSEIDSLFTDSVDALSFPLLMVAIDVSRIPALDHIVPHHRSAECERHPLKLWDRSCLSDYFCENRHLARYVIVIPDLFIFLTVFEFQLFCQKLLPRRTIAMLGPKSFLLKLLFDLIR